jgi:hypothetical protein
MVTEPAHDTLGRFVYQVDQLRTRRVLTEKDLRSAMTMKFEKGRPLTMQYHRPDEEDLRSYLLDFRKFVSPREPVHLNRVLNVAHRHITSDEIVAELAKARADWKKALKSGDVQFFTNEEAYPPERIMDLWINGSYFHDEPDKRRQLEALSPAGFPHWLFINAVVTTSQLVIYFGHVFKIVLREGLVSDAPGR